MKKNLLILFVMVCFSIPAFCVEQEITDEDLQKSVTLYKKGVQMVYSKAYSTALNCFIEALKYNPNMTDAYYNIASIYIAQKRFDEAYETYIKIIKLNPYDYESILQAAKIAYNKKNYVLALNLLKEIPDDYENYKLVQQLCSDSKEMINNQKTEAVQKEEKIQRENTMTAVNTKKVLIDKFNSPAGVAIDSQGNMFVACFGDNSIVKVDKNQNRTRYASGSFLKGPVGIAIDKYDNMYVANFEADNILKITKNGNASIFMDKVSKPYFLYIKNDILYVSEQGNDVVLTYNLTEKKTK